MKINKTLLILLVISIVLSIILSSTALIKVNNLYNETVELAGHLLYYTEAFNDLLDILAGPNEQDTADFNFNEL